MKLDRLPKLSSKKTKKEFDFNLPEDYVISKFYELGYKVYHNSYLNVYQSCCPLCHEGDSWGRKKRCYYLLQDSKIYCHNCGVSLSPYNWIRQVSGMTHEELSNELDEGEFGIVTNITSDDETPEINIPTLPVDSINLLDPAQTSFYDDNENVQAALIYVQKRRLDTAINRPDALYFSLKDKFQSNRLIIPFKDEFGKIIFYQTRKIFNWDDGPNYLSKPLSDKSLFGIDKIDTDQDTIFLFEGPIDSFFCKNGLGVAGINSGYGNYTPTQSEQLKDLAFYNKIWILDSQWIDNTAREKTISLLERDESVFLWPKSIGLKFKDFNEACIAHKQDSVSLDFIKGNTVQGRSGILKFNLLMKA